MAIWASFLFKVGNSLFYILRIWEVLLKNLQKFLLWQFSVKINNPRTSWYKIFGRNISVTINAWRKNFKAESSNKNAIYLYFLSVNIAINDQEGRTILYYHWFSRNFFEFISNFLLWQFSVKNRGRYQIHCRITR